MEVALCAAPHLGLDGLGLLPRVHVRVARDGGSLLVGRLAVPAVVDEVAPPY